MRLQVEHRFAFEYDAFISESFLELRVQPKTTADQTAVSFVLSVGPPARVHRYADWNDNITHHFTVTEFHDRIEVAARSVVDTHPASPPLEALGDPAPAPDVAYPLLDFLDLGGPVVASPALRAAHRAVKLSRGAPLGEQVRAIGAYVHGRFEYQKDVTRYDSTTEDLLRIGGGVCQDFAHLTLGLLRLSGIPCRYVSGYLHVERKPREPAQSHAWVEVHSPSAGWVPFDPTHNRPIDERYVVVGHGRHYDDVPPNRGIYRGNAREALRAEVHTQPVTTKAPAAFHEEIRQLDVAVFRVPPARRASAVVVAAEDQAQQQQQ